MSLYYSASTGGFYDTATTYDNLFVERINTDPATGAVIDSSFLPNPDGAIADAVEITTEEHYALLVAQAGSKIITADANGHPVAVDPPTPPLDQTKAALCAQIDAAADATYIAIGGPSPGRLAEYQQAKADAVAFKATGYVGAAPATVACWEQATGWTGQQACDDILATAAQWEGALVAIRTARLVGKADVNAAADAAAAQVAAEAAMANIGMVPAGL